jgi:predicted enzyme related to lactoylglutathione lyase
MLRTIALVGTLMLVSSSIVQDTSKATTGRVLGIAGIFFKSSQQKPLYSWYEKHLGFKKEPDGGVFFNWRHPAAPDDRHSTTWAIFPSGTKYFDPSPSPFMINYVVDDLDAILKRLAAEGVKIDPRRETDIAGRFAWIYDADGNKIELWEPAKQMLRSR